MSDTAAAHWLIEQVSCGNQMAIPDTLTHFPKRTWNARSDALQTVPLSHGLHASLDYSILGHTLGLYTGYVGIMEKKMETTMLCRGYIRYILGMTSAAGQQESMPSKIGQPRAAESRAIIT